MGCQPAGSWRIKIVEYAKSLPVSSSKDRLPKIAWTTDGLKTHIWNNIFYVRLDHFPLVPSPFSPTHLEQVPANTVDSRILSIQIYSMNCLVTVNIAKRLTQYRSHSDLFVR